VTPKISLMESKLTDGKPSQFQYEDVRNPVAQYGPS